MGLVGRPPLNGRNIRIACSNISVLRRTVSSIAVKALGPNFVPPGATMRTSYFTPACVVAAKRSRCLRMPATRYRRTMKALVKSRSEAGLWLESRETAAAERAADQKVTP